MSEYTSDNGKILDARLKRARVVTVTVLVAFAVSVAAAVTAFAVDSHLRGREHTDYVDYLCCDYNLKCIAVGRPDGKYYTGEDENYVFRYNRVKGESTDDFVNARVCLKVPLATAQDFVLQNRSSFVNVIREWTVKDVFVYEERTVDGETVPKFLVRVTDLDKKQKIVSEIRKIADSEQGNATGALDFTNFYLRLTFEESESIVWDSWLMISEDGAYVMHGGLAIGDKYYEIDSDSRNPCVLIGEDSALHSFIEYVFETYKTEE